MFLQHWTHLWKEEHGNDLVSFSVHSIRKHMMSVYSIIDDASFVHLLKVLNARFPHCKVTTFLFVINICYLRGNNLRLYKYLFPFQIFTHSCSHPFYHKEELSLLPYLFIHLLMYLFISVWTYGEILHPSILSFLWSQGSLRISQSFYAMGLELSPDGVTGGWMCRRIFTPMGES